MVTRASIILGLGLVLSIILSSTVVVVKATTLIGNEHNYSYKNAYATMMYMGTPRDYEFYVAIRVMLRSLSKLRVEADLVVIASEDVPPRWIQTLELEDGARVVKVKNLHNPYRHQKRFKLTLNKLYAWSLVDYERVVMLDADNLFLKKTDELFQCGQFCAAFINPCIFHTGLFVLEPSMDVFNDMVHELKVEKSNPDGADQGFIGGYFPDLLDKPMFHPDISGDKLNGTFRLPLGYQMDASYYYLQLRWNVPCGPNSVITFPSAPWLKPWYWWSWPVLPLGLDWHQTRSLTIGYGSEMTVVVIQIVFYLVIIAMTRMTRPNLSKLCYRQSVEKNNINSFPQMGLRFVALWSILAAYIVPFFFIPYTVHPLMGWALYLLGAFTLSSIVVIAFMLPWLHVLMPWLGISGALFVMAYPWYGNGITRALSVFAYGFCCAPVIWISFVKLASCLNVSLEREAFLTSRISEYVPSSGLNKLF